MSLTMNQGGWTGKVLRVDLTNRTATALDTAANFGQYWGGTGIGYKAIWDSIQARQRHQPRRHHEALGLRRQRHVGPQHSLVRL